MNSTSLTDRLLLANLPVEERANGQRLVRALSLVEEKLRGVEDELERRTRSDVPTISLIGEYLVDGGGKRIRPALLLLASRLLGYEGAIDVKYAAVLELIHTATLVHDDIIDGADTRRGRVSVNRRWGNELTVLFGDYLYMKGMKVALEEGDVRVLDLLADVTLAMTEGEILGAERRGSVDLTISDYLEVVRRKTALLFAAACRIPAFLVPGAEERAETLWGFGLALGTAFQLQDDLLDYTASEEDLGKPVLSDLREGKLTLPLILSLPEATPAERTAIETVMREKGFVSVPVSAILEIVDRLGALEKARRMVEEYAGRARDLALTLPEGDPGTPSSSRPNTPRTAGNRTLRPGCSPAPGGDPPPDCSVLDRIPYGKQPPGGRIPSGAARSRKHHPDRNKANRRSRLKKSGKPLDFAPGVLYLCLALPREVKAMSFQRLLRSLRPAAVRTKAEVTLDDEIALYRRRAEMALREERWNDALVFLAKILRLNPYDLAARMAVAQTFHRGLEEPTKAILTYEKVIAAAGYDESNPYCASAREGIRELSTSIEEPPFQLNELVTEEADQEDNGGLPQTIAL